MARLIAIVLVLALAASAHAQRRRRETFDVTARHAQRLADLAREAQLTEAQATAALAQMPRPPHAPTIHHVAIDTRPDGSRNVFGLMDTEESVECRYDGGEASDCRRRRPETDVFWVQIDAQGEVTRVGLGVPEGVVRAPGTHQAAQLRLFTPSPGAAAVALIDGLSVSSSRPIEYGHVAWLWDGRTFSLFAVLQLAVPAESFFGSEIGTVEIAADGHAELRWVECGHGCRCHIPRDPEDEARQLTDLLAHHASACTAQHSALTAPAGLHLVDDDLALHTPRRTRDEALAARAVELAAAWSITSEQATAIVGAVLDAYQYPSPHFERPLSTTLSDGTRAFYGVLAQSRFDGCVYFARGVPVHDAVRQCATEASRYGSDRAVLSVRIAPDGSVAEVRRGYLDGEASILAQHLVAETSGDVGFCAELERPATGDAGARRYTQLFECLHHGTMASAGNVTLVGIDESQHGGVQFIGEIVVQATGPDGQQTLRRRSGGCSSECICDPLPLTTSAVHAAMTALTRTGGACTPWEEAIDLNGAR